MLVERCFPSCSSRAYAENTLFCVCVIFKLRFQSYICTHSEQYFGYKLGVTIFEAKTFFSLKPYLFLNSGVSFFNEETIWLGASSLWMPGPWSDADFFLYRCCCKFRVALGWFWGKAVSRSVPFIKWQLKAVANEDDPYKAIRNSYLNKSLVFRIFLRWKANPYEKLWNEYCEIQILWEHLWYTRCW